MNSTANKIGIFIKSTLKNKELLHVLHCVWFILSLCLVTFTKWLFANWILLQMQYLVRYDFVIFSPSPAVLIDVKLDLMGNSVWIVTIRDNQFCSADAWMEVCVFLGTLPCSFCLWFGAFSYWKMNCLPALSALGCALFSAWSISFPLSWVLVSLM